MEFNIAIEPGTENTAYGVVVPDLPGCFSAGDTLDEAMDNAREAIALWFESVIKDGKEIPVAKTLAEHQINPDFAGWIWAVVEVPVERYFDSTEKLKNPNGV
ncbi:MAG: type II toxin-antitoxin system HicB family antitoxin [Sulfuriferula sp.]|jgi:predicted RNase H-like HicB family nuclease